MGGVLDGMPSMVKIDIEEIRRHLQRRRPGSGPNVSQRDEPDELEILSGLTSDGLTLGTPIGFIIRNRDARSGDYDDFRGKLRPNHADFTYLKKYGIHDFNGGGRASARATVACVVGGSIVRQWLGTMGIEIEGEFVETNSVAEAKARRDSTGGIVKCSVKGLKAGIGNPVFGKLHARLAEAMMGINAAKGFEYGDGFRSATMLGSECLDEFYMDEEGEIRCQTNHSGGIQGGISNGMPVEFKVYFKPTPTLPREIGTIDIDGNNCTLPAKGRHDPCVAVRAVPVVESMAALVIGDLMLS